MAPRSNSRRAFARKAVLCAFVGALPFATPLGGCVAVEGEQACTLLGCDTRLAFELGPRELVLAAACAEGPLAVRACVDDRCAETTMSRAGTCEGGPIPDRLPFQMLMCDAGSPYDDPTGASYVLGLSLGMNERSWAGPRLASITIRSSSGEPLYQAQRNVQFEPRYANGKACGITCWETPDLPLDMSDALSGFAGACEAGQAGAGGAGGGSAGRAGQGGAAGQAGRGGAGGGAGGGQAGQAGGGAGGGQAGQAGAGGEAGQAGGGEAGQGGGAGGQGG